MTDVHELVDRSDFSAYLPLGEVESRGLGALYIADSLQIDELAVYIGDGMFKGISPEIRPQALTLRLRIDNHKDSNKGDALRPYLYVNKIDTSILEQPAVLMATLLPQLTAHYQTLVSENTNVTQRMTNSELQDRLNLYKRTLRALEAREKTIDPIDGLINMLDTA